MTEYNIRLNPNCASVVNTGLKFKSGDKGIIFVIAVDELNTAGVTAKIVFQRANGTSVESDITGTDGVFTYKTLGNEFAVPGKTVADVKFYAADTRVSTASFVFEVSADTMDGLGAGAGGYSDRLEQLVTEAEKAGELTEQARAELEEAESDMKETEAEMAAVLQKFKEQYGEVGALNPRGNWNNATNYRIRDTVYHNSSTWICLTDNVGVEPSDANKQYWMRSTDLQSIINGTTPAGNALKLNGLTAEEFVLLEAFKKIGFMNKQLGATRWSKINKTTSLETTFYTAWGDAGDELPTYYGSGIIIPTWDSATKFIVHLGMTSNVPYNCSVGYMRFTDATTYTIQWKKFSDGGNADTVDGYHASDFAKSEQFSTQGDFTWMQSKIGNLAYRLQLHNGEVQYWESTDGGANWAKKATLNKNYLPLTGGTQSTIDGGVIFRGGYDGNLEGGEVFFAAPKNSTFDDGVIGVDAYSDIFRVLGMHDGMSKAFLIDFNSLNGHNYALHTGNSLKVQASNDAPTDTATMWYDTANKTWKRYADGAWTAA